jgi:ATP-binding cassette, subfamily F, member 3
MIFLRDLTLRRGAKLLFDHATVSFLRGQKIGVTGANGAGKSSLFSLIKGDLHADVGDIEVQPRLVFGEVAQDLPHGDRPAIEYVLDGDAELRVIEAQLRDVEHGENPERLGELHEALAGIGGYAARARAARLMNGLGFAEGDLERAIDTFSGGWRVRLNLARALMARSDLLLLDEPTNHLDLDAIIWLEGWLRTYSGTLLLISHDREFLDNTVDIICHVEGRGVRLYSGNYSAFERQRAEMLSQQKATYDKQQREIAHMRSFVERFRAKATKARQAQSRIKALAKFDEILPAHVNSPFAFAFRQATAQADPALVLDDVSVGYDGNAVLSSVRLTLRAGARIGLLGRNGAGKSTLIKLLAGDLAPISGTRTQGKDLAIGYFEQRQLDQLREEDSPLQHLTRLDPGTREQELRDFLGGFDFRGDDALARVGQFSGGERSRLALALIAWQRPNVLLLDEPTNHLDIEMRHALTRALQEYVGAMVLVSHDRSLLRTACDQLFLVERGRVREFDGDLESYRQLLSASPAEDSQASQSNQSRREQRRVEAEARAKRSARRRPIETQVQRLEKDIESLTQEKERLENLIASPDMYDDARKEELRQFQFEQARVGERLHLAEERWLELSAHLESLNSGS